MIVKMPSKTLSTRKGSILNTDMGLFKEQKKHIKYKTIYIRNIKMKNRNIHSKVISVKLFCREKVLRMYCTFILICWSFANKILCLRPEFFSNVLFFLFVLYCCLLELDICQNISYNKLAYRE